MELVLATNNANKLREIQAQLALSSVQVHSPLQVGVPADFDVEETGETFTENALLKAKSFSTLTKLPTVADDSGLMVTALNGEPGVHSKRWIEGSDHDRNLHLLKKLENAKDRSAVFITVLALYLPDSDQVHFFEGTVSGKIINEERGSDGFGYDPVFVPDGYDRTFAELGLDVKNRLSHRARAVQKLKTFLEGMPEGNNGRDLSTTTESP